MPPFWVMGLAATAVFLCAGIFVLMTSLTPRNVAP